MQDNVMNEQDPATDWQIASTKINVLFFSMKLLLNSSQDVGKIRYKKPAGALIIFISVHLTESFLELDI